MRAEQLGHVALHLAPRRQRDSSYERAARQGQVRAESDEQLGGLGG